MIISVEKRSSERLPDGDYLFFLNVNEMRLPWFWRCITREDAVRGDGTVWHWYKSGKRCGTMLGGIFSDWQTVEEWERKDKEEQE